jgi:hypothetical protein
MEVRLRLKIDTINEKVLGAEVIPADRDDGSLHAQLQDMDAREAKKLLTEGEWQFTATTTSLDGVHYDLYRLREPEEA